LQPGEQRQISIISDMPVVLSLPWELLHDEQGFLALRTRHPVSIVRRLPQSELAELPIPFEPPLRVLVVTARPDDAGFVDPRSVGRELLDEVQEHIDEGTIAVEFLRPPTLQALRTRLADARRPPIHVLHFDGHGTFRSESVSRDGLRLRDGEQGMLLFENDEGKRDLVKAEDLGDVLQDTGVKLAVLNACQSAISSTEDAFSSVAARLIKSGVDAVVAMSASVLVACATRYVEAFYGEL
jgi:CHAT domain-containing protein